MTRVPASSYLCPACRGPCRQGPQSWECSTCARTYPILFGIPDFRLNPDRYLSLQQERDKAARLHAFGQTHTFPELVAYYYEITDDVPPAIAPRYADYVLSGVARGQDVLHKLPAASGRLLDIGCGAGGLVAAACQTGRNVVGMDIALRWLVIAQKRLQEAGLEAELVCADITASPFAPASFEAATALDLFEHTGPCRPAILAVHDGLAPGGMLFATAANRFTLTSYPPAGLVGVGFLPGGLRKRYVQARRGLDTLRHLSLLSPRQMRKALGAAGFRSIRLAPLEIGRARGLGGLLGYVRPIYNVMRKIPGVAAAMVATGPAFEILARKPLAPASAPTRARARGR